MDPRPYDTRARKRRRKAKLAFVAAWKAERGCAWCGEDDPIVLDVDHISREGKHRHLKPHGPGVYIGWRDMSWSSIHAELVKCQVLCANCHRRKTWAEAGGK